MSIPRDVSSATDPTPLDRGLRWCLGALQLWGRAPIKLFTLSLVLLAVEGALQLIPWAGVTLSKIVVPILLFGILLGLDECARGRRMRWSSILEGFRRRPFPSVLAMATMYGLGVFAVQQGVAWLAYGWPAVDAVLFGHLTAYPALATSTFEYTLLLPGVLVSVLFILAPCLFLLDGLSPGRAIFVSIRIVAHMATPFAVLLCISLGFFMLMLVTPWMFALALIYVPWSTACIYIVWQDLRPVRPTVTGC